MLVSAGREEGLSDVERSSRRWRFDWPVHAGETYDQQGKFTEGKLAEGFGQFPEGFGQSTEGSARRA